MDGLLAFGVFCYPYFSKQGHPLLPVRRKRVTAYVRAIRSWPLILLQQQLEKSPLFFQEVAMLLQQGGVLLLELLQQANQVSVSPQQA